MPCDYNKYPPNWKTETRPRILKRANNCCEFCGVKNYSKHPETNSKVILTIAHLDHDSENWQVSDDRLRALCQKCHNNYDCKIRKAHIKEKQNNLDMQIKLF